jgi:hypothetical protein
VDAGGLSALEFSLLVGLGSLLAGFLGALSGLGGGVVIVPLLTLALGVDIRYAIGASLMAVIATSSGAAAAYVREGYTNIRLGMLLEIATTTGGLSGAEAQRHVSRPHRRGVLSRPRCTGRFWTDVRRRIAVGPLGHRLRRRQGAGHGSRDARPF